jgi:hypothetical protein
MLVSREDFVGPGEAWGFALSPLANSFDSGCVRRIEGLHPPVATGWEKPEGAPEERSEPDKTQGNGLRVCRHARQDFEEQAQR